MELHPGFPVFAPDAGVARLVERYREEARLAADKYEQKQLDEFAQRLRPPTP